MRIEEVYTTTAEEGAATASKATTYFTVDRDVPGGGHTRALRVEDHRWPFDKSGYWKVDMWMAQQGWAPLVALDEADADDPEDALYTALEILGWQR